MFTFTNNIMSGFTVSKLKQIGTSKKSIKEFKNFNKKKPSKKSKNKKNLNELPYKEKKRLLKIGRDYAEDLRNRATHWELVMKDIIMELGYNFVFQYPVVAVDKLYILDFYFPDYKLCIEIDGVSTHGSVEQQKADRIRTKKLSKLKISVIRLWNNQVERFSKNQIDQIIKSKIQLIVNNS